MVDIQLLIPNSSDVNLTEERKEHSKQRGVRAKWSREKKRTTPECSLIEEVGNELTFWNEREMFEISQNINSNSIIIFLTTVIVVIIIVIP